MDVSKEDICQLAYEGKCDRVKELVLKNNKYPTKQDEVSYIQINTLTEINIDSYL